MRLVGAKNSFIRWPFFLEGAWIGLIGAIVPVIIMTLGYHQVYNMFNPQLLRSNYSLIRPEDYLESQSINDCNRNDYWITRFSYFNASFLEN